MVLRTKEHESSTVAQMVLDAVAVENHRAVKRLGTESTCILQSNVHRCLEKRLRELLIPIPFRREPHSEINSPIQS